MTRFMGQTMTKLESVQDIRDTTARLLETLMGSDGESIRMAEEALQKLIDRFYRENKVMVAPPQYEAAKEDFEYFMRLVDLAVAYYQDGATEGKG
jgi:hypothetical protein